MQKTALVYCLLASICASVEQTVAADEPISIVTPEEYPEIKVIYERFININQNLPDFVPETVVAIEVVPSNMNPILPTGEYSMIHWAELIQDLLEQRGDAP